jgi:P4 family phage/plasmid primase-like protien
MATQSPPKLYAVEAWALKRLIDGYEVAPDVPVRPEIWDLLNRLSSISEKWRAQELRQVVGEDWYTVIANTDPIQPQPHQRGKVPPHKLLRADEPTEPVKSQPRPTDDELGDQLIQKWAGDLSFFHGGWQRYQNGVHTHDPRIALDFWQVQIDNKQRGIRPNRGRSASIENYCQLKLMIDDTQLNRAKNYINLQNGLYNVDTAEFGPHRRDLFMTSQLNFDYAPRAPCTRWLAFLRNILVMPDGQPDEELIRLLQEAFGYSLTAHNKFRVSFWIIGPSNAGKSTLLNVLVQLSGSGHLAIDLETLKSNPYQLASVAGKRLVTFTEPNARSKLEDGLYKRLVSSDTISARQIRGEPFNYVPECKIWGNMNSAPQTNDRSNAIYNRIIIINVLNEIPKDKRDLTLDQQLQNELPGIFIWAMEGWERLKQQGYFTPSVQSERALDEYRTENDSEAAFVEDEIVRDESRTLTASDLYAAYKAWCEASGFKPRPKPLLAKNGGGLAFNQSGERMPFIILVFA